MLWFGLALLPAAAADGEPLPLQPFIDATPPGGVLRLAPGRYRGPATLAKPLTLDGGGKARLEGDHRGTVLSVKAGGCTVRGLTIAGSGDSHDGVDAGILVEGDDHVIEENVVEDVLFGIHLKQVNRSRVARNRVSGRPAPLGERGDAIRIWNSRHNRIEGNDFRRARDLTFANSPDNRLAGNRLRDARYALHLVFSPRTIVEDNDIAETGTGIVVLYSPDVVIRNNRIAHALDGGGACIAFKDSGEGLVEGNTVLHCAVGLQANAPLNDERIVTIRGNRFAHNFTGLSFYGEKGGHRILANRFENNLTQVAISAAGVAAANVWEGNYWDDYQGFDRNRDGIGDTPYEIYLFADRIWMETPRAVFFRNSPVLELLDLLERLAPFSSPTLVLRDPRPIAHRAGSAP